MIVRAWLAPGRQVSQDDFTDLTDVPVSSVQWAVNGQIMVEFDADSLPDDVVLAVKRRLRSASPEEEALREELTVAEPDPAGSLADQVAALAVQVKVLKRLVLGETEQETP